MVSEQEAKLSPMELDEAKARELEEKFDLRSVFARWGRSQPASLARC